MGIAQRVIAQEGGGSNCPAGNCLGAIIRGLVSPGGDFPGSNCPGGSYPGEYCTVPGSVIQGCKKFEYILSKNSFTYGICSGLTRP